MNIFLIGMGHVRRAWSAQIGFNRGLLKSNRRGPFALASTPFTRAPPMPVSYTPGHQVGGTSYSCAARPAALAAYRSARVVPIRDRPGSPEGAYGLGETGASPSFSPLTCPPNPRTLSRFCSCRDMTRDPRDLGDTEWRETKDGQEFASQIQSR